MSKRAHHVNDDIRSSLEAEGRVSNTTGLTSTPFDSRVTGTFPPDCRNANALTLDRRPRAQTNDTG